MKQMVMFTMGTRGDVQPYIYLAQALEGAGYAITLGSHPCWRKLVEDAGVTFVPVGPDIDIEKEAAIIRGKEKNAMMAMMKTMNFVFRIVEQSSEEVYEHCRNKDLILVAHSHMGAAEAEALHIPTVDITLQTEMLPEINKPRNLFQKGMDSLFGACINPLIMKPYNRIRKAYGLKKVKTMDAMMSPKLNLIPISRYVIEPNPYWASQNKLVGYWYDEPSREYEPTQEVKDFLEKGEKPIILALGAMSFESVEESDKLKLFVDAFQRTNKRAIIQGFHKSLEHIRLPENMLAVDAMPHSYLFRQGFCVIHHGGFGTSSSALIYGAPAIIIPHALDQFGIAQRFWKLGVTTQPIKAAELSVEQLTDRITYLDTHYEEILNKVLQISKQVSEEHGLDTAVRLIQEAIEG